MVLGKTGEGNADAVTSAIEVGVVHGGVKPEKLSLLQCARVLLQVFLVWERGMEKACFIDLVNRSAHSAIDLI